ncbi:MAG: oligosaccharide flippase family protein [Deltaproteobacteria bacterium]|nr:oligosaccharide flippase family protein [Deltaproteobacteria bacterium]
MTDSAHVDRSTAWIGAASVVSGILDALSTILVLWLGVTTGELGAATIAVALFPIIDRLGGIGLISAAVKQPEIDQASLSTICWLGVIAATAMTGALAIGRVAVGPYLPDPIVATLLVAYSARLIPRQFSAVSEALLKRDLRYRELAMVKIVASIAEIVVKLGAAYLANYWGRELAIWCFVLAPIATALTTTVGTLLYLPWRPHFQFRRDVARRAIHFTAAVSGGEMLYYAYTSADYLVIGWRFGWEAVGVYRLAYELVLDVVRMLSLVTAEVAFPTFARLASQPGRVAEHLVRFTRQNLIVLAPFLVYVGIEADDLLALLFGHLPAEAATVARILCIVGALRTLGFILPSLLAGVGRPSRVLVYNAIATVVLPLAFLIATHIAPGAGFVSVAWAWAVGYPIAFGALLVMALPSAGVSMRRYFGALGGITGCAIGALVAAGIARLLLPDVALVRVLVEAPIVLFAFAGALWRVEGVSIAAIVRSLRGGARPATNA